MKIRTLFLLGVVLTSASSFAQGPETKNKESIREKVNLFFKALEKKDTALYRSLIMPGGQLWTVRNKQDTLRTSTRTFEKDISDLAGAKSLFEEKPYLIDITIHNDIAMAWVPYQFILDGKLSHCGIDVFTFLNTDKGWKIINASYSVEPGGCEALKKKYHLN